MDDIAFTNQEQGAVLPKGRSTANSGTKVAVLFKDRSSDAVSGTKTAVLSKGRPSTAI